MKTQKKTKKTLATVGICTALVGACALAPLAPNSDTYIDNAYAQEMAQNAVENVAQNVTTVSDQATIAQGSAGFFEYNGSSYAANIVKNPESTSGLSNAHTSLGSSDDATSLNNMRIAIEQLSKINSLRKLVGLSELKVCDTLVAISQVQINYASVEMGHAGNSGSKFNVGENLSWGYFDPFTGWYDEEKAVFDAYYMQKTGSATTITGAQAYEWANKNYTGKEVIGHYLNIITPDYGYTGFGYNTKNSTYRNSFGQVFAYESSEVVADSGDTVYTLSEYYERFMTYYAQVCDADYAGGETDTSTEDALPFYRLYNSATSEHLFTSDKNEYDTLINYGWTQEGTDCNTPKKSQVGIYRLYNPALGDAHKMSHHYTTDQDEATTLVSKYGWVYDNNAQPLFYSAEDITGIKIDGASPVYRLYNDALSAHHYTLDQEEMTILSTDCGWTNEDVGFYAYKTK